MLKLDFIQKSTVEKTEVKEKEEVKKPLPKVRL